jgi:hypothetical protein
MTILTTYVVFDLKITERLNVQVDDQTCGCAAVSAGGEGPSEDLRFSMNDRH